MTDVWLDDAEPFDEDTHEQQLAALLKEVGAAPRRVLDLGCGVGRMTAPLHAAGHDVVGIERNSVLADEAQQAAPGATIISDSFPSTALEGAFDIVLLLGNTLMTYPDVDEARALLQSIASVLDGDGRLVIDDIPGLFWPEVAEGNWSNGMSDDASAQLVWADDDAVFTLRLGDAVQPDVWTLQATDRCYRLWTMGEVRMLARSAGFSGVRVARGGHLIVLSGPEVRQ